MMCWYEYFFFWKESWYEYSTTDTYSLRPRIQGATTFFNCPTIQGATSSTLHAYLVSLWALIAWTAGLLIPHPSR
jgi:hypothetical protein